MGTGRSPSTNSANISKGCNPRGLVWPLLQGGEGWDLIEPVIVDRAGKVESLDLPARMRRRIASTARASRPTAAGSLTGPISVAATRSTCRRSKARAGAGRSRSKAASSRAGAPTGASCITCSAARSTLSLSGRATTSRPAPGARSLAATMARRTTYFPTASGSSWGAARARPAAPGRCCSNLAATSPVATDATLSNGRQSP